MYNTSSASGSFDSAKLRAIGFDGVAHSCLKDAVWLAEFHSIMPPSLGIAEKNSSGLFASMFNEQILCYTQILCYIILPFEVEYSPKY